MSDLATYLAGLKEGIGLESTGAADASGRASSG